VLPKINVNDMYSDMYSYPGKIHGTGTVELELEPVFDGNIMCFPATAPLSYNSYYVLRDLRPDRACIVGGHLAKFLP
jgi:hypothetical protein